MSDPTNPHYDPTGNSMLPEEQSAPRGVFTPTHRYLDEANAPKTMGDVMRLIGRYTESEGGDSHTTRQARIDLFEAYETWCHLGRPETIGKDLLYRNPSGEQIVLGVPWGDGSGNVPPPLIEFYRNGARLFFTYVGGE